VLTASEIDSGLVDDWYDRAKCGHQDDEDNDGSILALNSARIKNAISGDRVGSAVTTSAVSKSQSSRNTVPTAGIFSEAHDNGDLIEDDSVEHTTKAGGARVSNLTCEDLPNGAVTHFRYGFVTNFAYWLCCTRDPWSNDNLDAFHMMQKCWDFVYGQSLVYAIKGVRDVVYRLADKRWKEMRRGFGSTAIDALEEHFGRIGARTNAQRQTEAKRLLDNHLFVFGMFKQSRTGKLLPRQPFHGPLIIKTFAYLFKWTKVYEVDWAEIAGKSPLGALGLATAAVERALTCWAGLPDDIMDQLAEKPHAYRRGDKATVTSFNYKKWGLPTNDWIVCAIKEGFDSMVVMQPLIEKAIPGLGAIARSFRRHIPVDISDEE